jgi:hypothetical protein
MTSLSRLLLSFTLLAGTPALSQENEATVLEGFPDLRQTVTELMSTATRRLWVVTDYLTDGDIVSALYVARYRKIDVQVLLGKAKANAYMSRLSYLKAQNIPVFLKPDTLKPGAPTAILADDQLILVHGDLDFLSRAKEFKVTEGNEAEKEAFVAGFSEALAMKVPANARQIPLVGRPPRSGGSVSYPSRNTAVSPSSPSSPAPAHPQGRGRLPVPYSHEAKTNDPNGVYHYRRTVDPKPSDVPNRLPKGLKWDKQATREKSMMIKPVIPATRADGG